MGISENTTIDLMESEQALAVSDLIRSVIEPLEYYSLQARASEMKKYSALHLREMISEDPESILIACEKNKIIGFCINYCDAGLLWLEWIGVAPTYRNQGLGDRLLMELEASARRRQCHKIWCDCRTTNEPSKQMLEKLGYHIICQIANHWYGQDFILWEKSLA